MLITLGKVKLMIVWPVMMPWNCEEGHGAVQAGAVQDGAVQDGAVQDGDVQDGAVQDGVTQDGVGRTKKELIVHPSCHELSCWKEILEESICLC
ncbi:UNVERIFIED_CONTAM: hypothetical protein K2H54_024250 [Gekko kuhli]